MLIEADLPDDVEALRALVVEQARTIAELEAAGADAEVENARLRAIIDAFMRHRFGARSEQLDEDQLQLGLEDVETALGRGARPPSDAKAGVRPSDRPRKSNRGSLPAHLERIEQVVDVEDKACPCCGGALHLIGEDVAERLDVVPDHLPGAGHPPPALRLPLLRRRGRPGAGAGADRRGRHADRGADRPGAGRQVCRPPAALPPGADLRPPGHPARPLDAGRLGRPRGLVAAAACAISSSPS